MAFHGAKPPKKVKSIEAKIKLRIENENYHDESNTRK